MCTRRISKNFTNFPQKLYLEYRIPIFLRKVNVFFYLDDLILIKFQSQNINEMSQNNLNLPFKVLREISQNIEQQVKSPPLGYFQANNSKSIYTEESRMTPGYTLETQYQQIDDEDFYQFLQKQKSLKERIYEKLDKKNPKKNKENKQATFRPTHLKLQLQQHKVKKNHDGRNKAKLGEMLNLTFHDRQQKTLQNRQKKKEKLRTQRSTKQVQQCTFRPKLTSYRPKRI